jgi:peptidyl-tRNA hydrolase, PTH2 family
MTVQDNIKQVIVVRVDLKMRRGKESAQVAHAAMEWLRDLLLLGGGYQNVTDTQHFWLIGNHAKIVVGVDSLEELTAVQRAAEAAGVMNHFVVDHGLTEFHGEHTTTCLALGPDYASLIDPITKHLKLR